MQTFAKDRKEIKAKGKEEKYHDNKYDNKNNNKNTSQILKKYKKDKK